MTVTAPLVVYRTVGAQEIALVHRYVVSNDGVPEFLSQNSTEEFDSAECVFANVRMEIQPNSDQ